MNNRTQCSNGAGAYINTGNPLVTLFFNIGASRNNLEGIKKDFEAAYKFDPLKATAILLFSRDIRHNGAGERNIFKTILKEMAISDKTFTDKVIKLVPEIGRFDDLRSVLGTDYEALAVNIWADAIRNKNVLSSKWADRSDKFLQKALKTNEAGLRKILSSIRKEHIVETKMCEKHWSDIEYGKLPSVAGMRYAKAFGRNDGTRYSDFIASKDTKVNASAAFPHDVYRMWKSGDQREAASKYWDNLPELEIEGSILPICDVSGSMMCTASGSITCLDVSISLGVYLSQRCKGPFQNTLLTFSENPSLVQLPETKDIGQLFSFVQRMNWGMNTNIEKTYELILDRAQKLNARQDQIPEYLLIMSD